MLGTSLSCHFLEKGHDLYGLSRGRISRSLFPKEKFLKGDIADKGEIDRIFESVRPEAVIHCAALSDVDYCEKNPKEASRVNGEGTQTVAKAARAYGALFCYISSDYVFDGENRNPYREDDPCAPLNAYGKSKLLGEEYTQALSKRYFIIRTSWLFGENRDSFVHHVLEWAKTKKEIPLVADKWGIPTYTPDLAEAIHSLFKQNAPSGIYHITSGGEECNWLEYGKAILDYSGLNGISLSPISLKDLKLAAKRPHRSVLSHEKFSDTTKRDPRSWQEALKEYLATVHPAPMKR